MQSILTSLTALALLTGLGSGPAIAQIAGNPNAADQGAAQQQRQLTRDDVRPDRPFGDLEVNLARAGNDLDEWMRGLSAAQQAELRGRCDIILGSQAEFGESVAAFCNAFSNTNQPGMGAVGEIPDAAGAAPPGMDELRPH